MDQDLYPVRIPGNQEMGGLPARIGVQYMSTDVVSKETLFKQYQGSSNLEARISLHERFSINPYGWHRWIFDQFEMPPNANILELGCGVGKLWSLNADRVSPNWHITLSDFSPGMLKKAKENTSRINCRFVYELVDVTDIPFDEDQFDAIIANHVLYYITDKANKSRAFFDIRRVLKNGGKFYASTNGSNHMREMAELVKQFDALIPFVVEIVRNFSLEDGPSEVAEWFSEVEVRRYNDGLMVDDVNALIEFILSMSTVFSLEDERKAELSGFIKERFAEQGGVVKIQKDMGMICARRNQ